MELANRSANARSTAHLDPLPRPRHQYGGPLPPGARPRGPLRDDGRITGRGVPGFRPRRRP
ncbi:hypothetical protein GCM10023220_39800 [Streptomyces ziwulingensis]|uniref:Uncharacterized protein n=1 Tax=Streptomyces ziwulingensis TaxID=1045501 RepID=A0ABP9C9T4_9ACTN